LAEAATTLLATKLFIPSARQTLVQRPRLMERLQAVLTCRLTLVSAPAGFGKTTLVSEWVAGCERPVAWLSLDESDNDPTRFLAYLVAALQTVAPRIGEGALAALQSPQPPPPELLLTTLINEISSIPDNFVLVLDDYHVLDSKPAEAALTFLVDHLPPQLHLVIATREDPPLPLASLRVRGQLTELRAADLRFTSFEAAEFLNRVMDLNLSAEDVAALENRTEGWIAGLQLAALSMQGRKDATSFIKSFTGSHHFVLDYLVEEVLEQQPESVQNFLLRTSILDRLCGPLCDAVFGSPSTSGQETLEYLEHANLFIVPLDNERRWYRYHHLFAELLRQRLGRPKEFAELNLRASQWYEDNNLAFEAFHHATAANDIERAERLIGNEGMGLHSRSVATAVLKWLASLPGAVLDAHPQLWLRSATLALMAGQTTGVEEKLQAAEKALQNIEQDTKTRDLSGQIACARATLALTRYDPGAMVIQARRALEFLHPDNLTFRFTANWALGTALMLQGDRAGAGRAHQEGIAISQQSGHVFSKILATSSFGRAQELDNHLQQAAETYRSILPLFGNHPQPSAEDAHLGLARICYEWNDLETAEQHGQQSLQLARQYDRVIDRFIVSEVFLARLKLARGDVDGAAALLAEAEQSARQKNFLRRLPEIAAVQVLALLRQGQVAAAAQLARQSELPLSQARVLIAQDDPSAALAVLEPLRQQMEARGWADERLKTMVLQAVAQHLRGEKDKAAQVLSEALALAEPGGFIRIFVDEGKPMAELLTIIAAKDGALCAKQYILKLLSAFDERKEIYPSGSALHGTPVANTSSSLLAKQAVGPQPLIEPLSERELEVLRLLRTDLSGPEIARECVVSLTTVRTHTQNIYAKLGVNNRRAAVRRAEELDLL
jgi:LuxR family maltose regulon positive regulatory protein